MSQKRTVNLDLLKDLDENTFLGKVLTITDEEIAERFTRDFPAPNKAQIAAGSIGTLNRLELALLTHASKATDAITKLSDDFNKFSETEEFELLEIGEKIAKKQETLSAMEKLAEEVRRCVDMSQAETTARLPHIKHNGTGYYLCNDGNFYAPPVNNKSLNVLRQMFSDMFFGGGKKEKAEA